MPRPSRWSLSFSVPIRIPYASLFSPCVQRTPSISYSLIRQTLMFLVLDKITRFIIVHFSPVSLYFFPLRSKYASQHPVLEHPQFFTFMWPCIVTFMWPCIVTCDRASRHVTVHRDKFLYNKNNKMH
jgi:hypothetical protein